MIENILHDYLIHFNSYTKYYCAFKRDKYVDYINGTLAPEEILKNKDVNVLIKYICKLK